MRGRRCARSAPHSVPDPAAEISRLRRENDRLRMERDILKKLWPSSRNHRDEVPLDRGPPGCLAGAGHVRCAERVAVRLLRVAVTAGQPAQDRQSRSVGRYPAGSCTAPGTIRSAARPRRTASRGSNRQPQAGRAGHAPARSPGSGAALLSRVHNRQQAFPPGGGKPAGSELCRRPAQSSLVGRYHLHSDQRGLALPGRDPRPVHPQGGWLGHARSHACRTHHRCAHHGNPTAAPGSRPDPSFRPRQPSTPPATTATSCRPPLSSNR